MEDERRRRGGSVIWIIIGVIAVFLCCCLTLAAAGAAAYFYIPTPVTRSPVVGRVSESTEQSFSVGQAPTVSVNTYAGNIVVRTGQSGQVRIVATKRAPSNTGLSRVNVTMTEQSNGVQAKATSGGSVTGSTSVGFEVFVPPDAQLDLRTGAGNIDITDVTGNISAHTGAGNITVRGASGAAKLDTGAGNIDYQGSPSSDSALNTGAGEITLRLPADAGLNLVLSTGLGNINLDGFNVQGQISNRRVEGAIGANPLATINAQTAIGNITLRQQ